MRIATIILTLMLLSSYLSAQSWNDKKHLSHQDTLRGSITAERKWWDVLYYDLIIKPSFTTKTISGYNIITYKVVDQEPKALMQIDLQQPLNIDSVLYNDQGKVTFTNISSVWYISLPQQNKSAINTVTIYYSGSPHAAALPPWDGGWVWKQDKLGRPWMTVACQGIGASIWYPCKDHQEDEPDKGASLTMTVPNPLVAVANGRLKFKKQNTDNTTTYKWAVVNPINNYNLCPYIGSYIDISETYQGLKGDLDMSYWVLDYNYGKAKSHLLPQAKQMIKSFEKWFGPYPFYEDSYKLVDAPGYGMEHQSAVAYDGYQNGNRGKDFSGTGWGMKWDFLLVHESAHEWFGNSITAKDPADKWLQEGFACYADVLFMQDYLGESAANEYVIGTRRNIWNNEPIIGPYNVGKEGSSDMYPKARNMLHMIRFIINDDEKFRNILVGMNKQFYHQTVTTAQIEEYINKKSGIDFRKVFDQYLRTLQIPVFEYKIENKVLEYRFTNCLPDFSMPVKINVGSDLWITPTTDWQNFSSPISVKAITVNNNFYLNIRKVTGTTENRN